VKRRRRFSSGVELESLAGRHKANLHEGVQALRKEICSGNPTMRPQCWTRLAGRGERKVERSPGLIGIFGRTGYFYRFPPSRIGGVIDHGRKVAGCVNRFQAGQKVV
jgi:hypothetical protein